MPFVVILVTAVKGFAMWSQTVADEPGRHADRGGHAGGALWPPHRFRSRPDLRETPAALTQRFTTDFGFIREALTRLSTVFLRDIATGLALLGVMFWIDWQVTLLAILVLPIVAPAIAKIGRSCAGPHSSRRSRPP